GSKPLFVPTTAKLFTSVSYYLRAAEEGDIILQFADAANQQIFATPPVRVKKGADKVSIDFPPFTRTAPGSIFLSAILLDASSGQQLKQTEPIEYKVGPPPKVTIKLGFIGQSFREVDPSSI